MTVYEVLCEGYREHGRGSSCVYRGNVQTTYAEAAKHVRVICSPPGCLFTKAEDAEAVRAALEAQGWRAWIDTRVMPDAPTTEDA